VREKSGRWKSSLRLYTFSFDLQGLYGLWCQP
jgi:hypothetical protein